MFGNISKPLGRWLYSNLLMQTGNYAPGKHSYSYVLNAQGCDRLSRLIEIPIGTPAEVATQLYGAIIRGEEKPVYSDNGGRRYHPIQNIRREDRKAIFCGWWDYDIESCAANLVYQYAAGHHLKTYPEADDPFPAVARLIREKSEVRTHIATVAGVTIDEAKELIQSLFFKAPLTPNYRCSIFRLLGEDHARHEKLKQDAFVKELVADVKKMWRYAVQADLYDRAMQTFDGKEYISPKPQSSKHRHAIFVALERRVMEAIQDWFGTDRFPGILMHDGFLSRSDINTELLQLHVKNRTDFVVKLKKERIGTHATAA